jgi:tetratricopeptide (TPR) repeat protein
MRKPSPFGRAINSQYFRQRVVADLTRKRKTEPGNSPGVSAPRTSHLRSKLSRSIRLQSQDKSPTTSLNRRYGSNSRARGFSLSIKDARRKKASENGLEELLQNSSLLGNLKKEVQESPNSKALLLLARYQQQTRSSGQALLTVTRLLNDEPDHVQGLLLRAEVYKSLGRQKEAFLDLLRADELDPCEERLLGMLELDPGWLHGLLDRRPSDRTIQGVVKMLLSRGMVDQFLQLAERVKDSSFVAMAYASILKERGLNTQRQLCLEQCLKLDNDKGAVTKAILALAGDCIAEHKYYEALHMIERARHLEVESFSLQPLRWLSEGLVCILRRKYEEGIKVFALVKVELLEPRLR